MDEKFGSYMRATVEGVEFLLAVGTEDPLVLRGEEFEETCAEALYCLNRMPCSAGLILGQVVEDLPASISYGNLRPGQIILFERQSGGLVSVEVPYSKEVIDRNVARGDLNCSHTIINVPSKMVRPIYGIV